MSSIYQYRTVKTARVMPPNVTAEVKVEGTPAERWAKYLATAKADNEQFKKKRNRDAPGGEKQKRRGPQKGETNVSKVLAFMQGKGEVSVREIKAGLKGLTRKQVSDALKGLKERGDVEMTRYERTQKDNEAFWAVIETENA